MVAHIVHENRHTADPWSGALTGALTRHTVAAGALPVVITDVDIQPGERLLQALRRGLVDGLTISSPSVGPRWVDDLAHSGTPEVMISRHPRSAIPFVELDGHAAVQRLVSHLAELGRRRIGLIAGPQDRPEMALRLEGWRTGLAQAQLLQDDDLVVEAGPHAEAGESAARRLLERGPDAVIAMTDPLARTAWQVFEAAGMAVPRDIAVAGIDGTDLAGGLTTVRQPYDLIAESVVSELLAVIDGAEPNPATLLLGELHVDRSTLGEN